MLSIICTSILTAIIIINIITSVLSKDKTKIFSPVNMFALVYAYYCIMPIYTSAGKGYELANDYAEGLFCIGALLSYVGILIGFSIKVKPGFKKWNTYFTADNCQQYATIFFLIAFVAYSSLRGIHFTIFADEKTETELTHYGLEHYLLNLIVLYEIAVCLYIIKNKSNRSYGFKYYYLIIIYIIIGFLFAGTRSRIVYLALASVTVFYLYPKPKRMNYPLILGLGLALFLLFSAMDSTRSYSSGINKQGMSQLSYDDIKYGAAENYVVHIYSAKVMEMYSNNGDYIYFEPILTAALSPVPRVFFPWKPDFGYLMEPQIKIQGTIDGAIFINFTEGFISFGWFGVLLYGLFLGWLSKKFWSNYQNNPSSIGAIVALALWNGFTYVVVSRGSMASALTNYVLTICLPFWIAGWTKNLINKKTISK